MKRYTYLQAVGDVLGATLTLFSPIIVLVLVFAPIPIMIWWAGLPMPWILIVPVAAAIIFVLGLAAIVSFDTGGEESNEPIAQVVDDRLDLTRKVVKLHEESRVAQGSAVCSYCGRPVSDGEVKCAGCQAVL